MSLLEIHEPGETPLPHAGEGTLAVGIDLGTTNSVVAIAREGKPAALHDEKALRGPVRGIMSTRLHTVQVSTPPDQLLPLFRDGMVPIVFDGDLFYGLITRLDVVNHLRSKLRA